MQVHERVVVRLLKGVRLPVLVQIYCDDERFGTAVHTMTAICMAKSSNENVRAGRSARGALRESAGGALRGSRRGKVRECVSMAVSAV